MKKTKKLCLAKDTVEVLISQNMNEYYGGNNSRWDCEEEEETEDLWECLSFVSNCDCPVDTDDCNKTREECGLTGNCNYDSNHCSFYCEPGSAWSCPPECDTDD